MSTPDSVHPSVVLPVIPRLTVVLRPLGQRAQLNATLETLTWPVLAGAGLMVIQTVGFFMGRVLAVNLNSLIFVDTQTSARVLGTFSFLSIVLIAGVIALGHRALRELGDSQRLARQVAAVVLGVAYLHLILWLTRVVAAALASSATGSIALFVPDVFWWG